MREIKFRAWRKQENKMIHWGHIAVAWTAGALRDDPFTIVMQYTGLKDRNSVEIYESDIVKTAYGVEVIEYYKNGFYFGNPLHDNWDAEDVEVIGNIYEHPDLIKNYPEK